MNSRRQARINGIPYKQYKKTGIRLQVIEEKQEPEEYIPPTDIEVSQTQQKILKSEGNELFDKIKTKIKTQTKKTKSKESTKSRISKLIGGGIMEL